MKANWIVALALAVGLAACGETKDADEPAPGGAGGVAGGDGGGGGEATGGTFGAGGMGGIAGSGGPTCGNEIPESGEECDDGNTESGDGCSATCLSEGGCDGALDFNLLGELTSSGLRSVSGVLEESESKLQGSCGGTGSERVYKFQVGATGGLLFSVDSDAGLVAYARRSCGDEASEQLCQLAGQIGAIEVTAGETIYFVVDGPSGLGSTPYALATKSTKLAGEGETCARQSFDTWCRDGMRCGAASVCEHNQPPVLDAVYLRRYREADVLLGMDGHDPDQAIASFFFEFQDADGVPVVSLDLDGDGTPDAASVEVPLQRTWAPPEWFLFEALATDFPKVTRARVKLKDDDGAYSNEVIATLADPTVRSAGEACDEGGMIDRCDEGLVCAPEGEAASVCTEAWVLRDQVCADASVLPLGETTAYLTGPSLFEPPTSGCGAGTAEFTLESEKVFRLVLDADASEVTIEVKEANFDPIVYVLSSCVDSAAVLACNDDPTAGIPFSKVTMQDVAAGEYFVVVDGKIVDMAGAPGVRLTLTITP